MAASAGTVTLELDANSVRLLRELQKSQRATKRAATGMQKSMSNAFKKMGDTAKTFGTIFATAFAARAIRSVADAGIEMQKLERGMRVASGSVEATASNMAFLRSEASRLGLDLQSSGKAFVSLSAAAKGTALEGAVARDIFTAISETSRVMGLSAGQTEGALRAIEQMISKGNVQAEELRGQLGERLPGAFQIAARAMGKTTQELNKMLDNGEVLASDLLPALAKELRSTFGGQVADAAGDAQASINRMKTAIFELKASIAESGVLDAIGRLATALAGVIDIASGGTGFTGRAGEIESRIEEMTKENKAIMAKLSAFYNASETERQFLPFSTTEADITNLKELLKTNQDAIDRLKPLQLAVATGDVSAVEELGEIYIKTAKRANDYGKDLDAINKKYKTSETRIKELQAILDRFGGDLSEGQVALIMEEIQDEWSGGLEEIVIDTKRRFSDPIKKEMEKTSVYADQAARNMQDAFADFLFDPFEDGLKGMVKGFADAIRRMLANQAAANFFDFIKGAFTSSGNKNDPGGFIGAGLSALFPPGRAAGGPVAAGMPYTVGERGMEMFIPSESGTIVPHHELGGGNSVVNNYHFEAGADIATIRAEIIPMLERTKDVTKAEIMQMRAEGRG